MELLLVTGLSGAGKSSALRVLEDNDFYCADNIPPALIPDFAASLSAYHRNRSGAENELKAAIVIDVRAVNFAGVITALDKLKSAGYSYRVVFLDATDDALDKRYKYTRRAHPLSRGGGDTQEGIKKERELLEPVRGRADIIIDTTNYNEKELKNKILEFIRAERAECRVFITSFGFKRGAPIDLDMLFDVRFFLNPYYKDELKKLCGLDAPVRDYVLNQPAAAEYIDKITDTVKLIFPAYVREVKNFLNVGVGCTGGRHRSVAVAEEIARRLSEAGITAVTEHRDIAK